MSVPWRAGTHAVNAACPGSMKVIFLPLSGEVT